MEIPTRLQLALLGRLSLASGDELSRPIRLSSKKGVALLAYLAMSPDRAASREALATLLWGSCTDQLARHSLRQALVSLRKDLRGSNIFATEDGVVRLSPGLLEVDALEFEALSTAGNAPDLHKAAGLFQGDFLAGFHIEEEGFETWLQERRHHIQMAAARVCETFAERPELVGDGHQAVGLVERLLSIDPLREDWQRLALRLYARYRGRNEAIAQAEVFSKLLQRELDVGLEQETRALIEEIRHGNIERRGPEDRPFEPNPLPVERQATSGTIEPLGDEEAPRSDAGRLSRRRRWGFPALASGDRAAALFGVAALALTAGVVGSMLARPAPPAGHGVATTSPPAAPDLWRSPPLPSRPVADASVGREGGNVAIAVLPFTSHGEAGEPSHMFADIVTDDLTNLLSRVAGFRVISGETARSYRGQRVDAAAIGAELGIRYLLEGSVSTRGNQLRVNVELVDTKSRLQVWSGRFERTGADLHAIEDEIVKGLGRELQIEIALVESERGSKDPDVHDLIVRGWAAIIASRKSGLEGLRQSEAYFAQALARDPDSARAQTGLGAYHSHMAVQLYAADPAAHLAKAEAILQPLIGRHPNLNGPHAIMGLVHVARNNIEAAGQSFERSIALNPSHAPSHAQLGRVLGRLGRPQEGLEHVLYAMRLSPRDPTLPFWLAFAGAAKLELRRHDEAIAYFERALVLNPGQPRTVLALVAAHALTGNMDAARRQLEQLQNARPHLTREALSKRYGSDAGLRSSRLKEGLRLVLDPDL